MHAGRYFVLTAGSGLDRLRTRDSYLFNASKTDIFASYIRLACFLTLHSLTTPCAFIALISYRLIEVLT
jgi:hypothetical protein